MCPILFYRYILTLQIILDSCAPCSAFDPFRGTEGIYLAWVCSISKHEYRLFTLTVNPYNYHKTSLHDDSTPLAMLVLLFLLFPLYVAPSQKGCASLCVSEEKKQNACGIFKLFSQYD